MFDDKCEVIKLPGWQRARPRHFVAPRRKPIDRSLGVCELQQLTIPAASAKPAAAGPTSGVLLVKNMTVFLTFCSLHIFGISTWMVYSSRHQVCQATLPNFLAVFCDKFLAQLPVVPRRARCVNCINPSSKLEMADFWEIASLRIWYVRTGAAGARPSGD